MRLILFRFMTALLLCTGLYSAAFGMTEAEILAGAQARIEKHRKAEAEIIVLNAGGEPVESARVSIEQTRHEFLFGCNIFRLSGYPAVQDEAAYERQFAALFNYATLPFYWSTYQPSPERDQTGKLEAMARWCKRRGITTKGHPLIWSNKTHGWSAVPGWAPDRIEPMQEAARKRIADIVSHFAGLIDYWDVVNEATRVDPANDAVARWIERDGALEMVGHCLEWAQAANAEAVLIYNDWNVQDDGHAYENLAESLKENAKPVDAFGIQSHMHGGEWSIERLWQVCETYARFGKPLHFTEVSVISGEHGWERPRPWATTPEGEARQAEYVERLYTVLFSHPAVEAITWWDFPDGEWMGAPAGLVRADLTPKPAYRRLRRLIKEKWWTRREETADKQGRVSFRGFYGNYRITVGKDGLRATKAAVLRRGGDNSFVVTLKQGLG